MARLLLRTISLWKRTIRSIPLIAKPETIPARLLLMVAAAIVALIFLPGCGDQESPASAGPSAADLPPTVQPTPTLAVPVNGTPNIPRPPTPIITPRAGQEGETIPPAIGDGIALESAPGENSAVAPPAPVELAPVTLPNDATAEELVDLGEVKLAEGDFSFAVQALEAGIAREGGLSTEQVAAARFSLGQALLSAGQTDAAEGVFTELAAELSNSAPRTGANPLQQPDAATLAGMALYKQGEIALDQGRYAEATAAFEAYLATNPFMAAYIRPLLAEAFTELGDPLRAIAEYELALEAPAHRLETISIHRQLANLYLEQGNFDTAIAQYDAIHDLARTEFTRGEMTYLAGQAHIQAGNTEQAYERFLRGVNEYPGAVQSYWGLIQLVEAGVPVDEYQRGVVDYFAAAYAPGIEALQRYIDANPDTYTKDSHLYLAWSYEALGDPVAALAELEAFAAFDPARALFERAEMLSRAGDPASVATYTQFAETFPNDERAPAAAWQAASLAEKQADGTAAARYVALADAFPFAAETPEALARAAWLNTVAGNGDQAVALYQRLAEQYPANEYGSEALIWLMRAAESGTQPGLDLDALRAQAESLPPAHYFAIRARDVAAGVAPFTAAQPFQLPAPDEEASSQAEAESWLLTQLPAEVAATLTAGDISPLSPELAADSRRLVGETLWRLGRFEDAKAELESLRTDYAGDPLASYQLSLYFRDLGLYRSSIIAAASILAETGTYIFDAPAFIGRLIYPAYYADLILPLAGEYGYDPRLQFALVRQESLFESFARSGAAAQGLAQVIPDTGAWIAQRLAWPNYVNEDLYKPYVGLRFGAYYLSQQLAGFENQVHAALAAYNAGPGNAARWYEVAGKDHDAFVDTIDFGETRLYLERIYEGFNVYDHLYGR